MRRPGAPVRFPTRALSASLAHGARDTVNLAAVARVRPPGRPNALWGTQVPPRAKKWGQPLATVPIFIGSKAMFPIGGQDPIRSWAPACAGEQPAVRPPLFPGGGRDPDLPLKWSSPSAGERDVRSGERMSTRVDGAVSRRRPAGLPRELGPGLRRGTGSVGI